MRTLEDWEGKKRVQISANTELQQGGSESNSVTVDLMDETSVRLWRFTYGVRAGVGMPRVLVAV